MNIERANLNTILLAVVLAVLGWIGITTQNTSVSIAVTSETANRHEREILDLRQRMATIELKLAGIRSINAAP